MFQDMSRRSFLAAAAATAAALGIPATSARALAGGGVQPAAGVSTRKRAIRIAHMTDTHIEPEMRAGEGVGAAFEHVMGLKDRPELILSGGDHVMDSWDDTAERTRVQWELWSKVYKDHCTLPIKSCLGNHDIWAVNRTKAKVTGEEPNLGKQRGLDELGMSARYYAFEKAGWKFIVLDSVIPTSESGYEGGLDDEQFAWLSDQLLQTPATTPVLVLSHIPILHASMLLVKDDKQPRKTSRGLFFMDALRVVALFEKHPNVKVCISGHIHIVERIDLQGVSYLCNGAVCGNWWGAEKPQDSANRLPRVVRATPGYATIDLYEDGGFENEYHTYGWKYEG